MNIKNHNSFQLKRGKFSFEIPNKRWSPKMSNSNFQDVIKRLKRSVKDHSKGKEEISLEDQLKVIRSERERQERIDQEYQRRKEEAAERLIKGMRDLKEQSDF